LKRLAQFIKDPTRLQPTVIAKGARGKSILTNGVKKFEAKTITTTKGVLKKATISKRIPKGRDAMGKIHNDKGIKKAKGVLTTPPDIKLFSGKLAKTLVKTSWSRSAADFQPFTKKKKVKAQDESIVKEQRKQKLLKLPLWDLEELHKSNDLRTEPVKNFVSRTKARLIAKKLDDLQRLCKKKKLAVSGTKETLVRRLLGPEMDMLKTKMVEALVIFEADARKQEREQEVEARAEFMKDREKLYSAVTKLRRNLGAKTVDALNAHLRDYGLPVYGNKREKVERVLARLREDGEVEKIIAARASRARNLKLRSMDATALVLECVKTQDVLEDSEFKKILVDRLLLSEAKRMPGPSQK